MTRAAVLAAALLLLATVAGAQTNAGSSQQDFNGRSLSLALTDAPQQIQSASISRTGNPGPNTYYYWIVTQGTAGASSPSGPFIAPQSPGTLSGTNFNQITWPAVPNGVTYDVLRTTTPLAPTGACACAVATAVAVTVQADQSNSLGAYTVTALTPSAFTMTWTNESKSAGVSEVRLRKNGTQIFAIDSNGNVTCSGACGGGTINPTNGKLPVRANATTFNDAAASDIVNMFTGCAGTQYLGADGACHTASGAPAGTQTEVQYRSAGSFGAITNSAVDVSADASGSNRAMLSLTNTYTNSSASFSAHLLDLNCNSASGAAMNTLACGYYTLKNNNTVGQLGHSIGLALRYSDNSTGSATVLQFDGLYIEGNNAAGTTATGAIQDYNNINIANATLSSTSQAISNFNGLKYAGPIMGSNTTINKEIALNLGVIRATTAQVTTQHLINAGGCSDAGVYVPAVFCGGRVDIQSPLLMQNMTMGAASAAPQTVQQPYVIKLSNFHDNGTDASINVLTTTDNGASGTSVGIKNIVDVGGSSGTIALAAGFQGQISNSGAAVTTTAYAYDILNSSASAAVSTAVGFHAGTIKGANVTVGYGIWTAGPSDFNRFDGQVGIHKIPTTTSTLSIAGLPTSSAGLVSGDVWSNSGVLTIVP